MGMCFACEDMEGGFKQRRLSPSVEVDRSDGQLTTGFFIALRPMGTCSGGMFMSRRLME